MAKIGSKVLVRLVIWPGFNNNSTIVNSSQLPWLKNSYCATKR